VKNLDIKLILFDAYGTLFEFEGDQFRGAIAQILDDQRIDFDYEKFYKIWVDKYSESGVWGLSGPNKEDPYPSTVLNGSLPEWHSQWEIWRRQFEKAFFHYHLIGDSVSAANTVRELIAEADLYTDVRETLSLLSKIKIDLGLLSNADNDFLNASLSKAGLLFDIVESSESLRIYKPHRDIFVNICKISGFSPEQILYVGDSPIADIGGAHNAGLKTLWIRRNSTKNAEKVKNDDKFALMLEKLPDPDFVSDSLLSIPEIINC
tara:strand:- start:915 stop:1703 length:789 start_codon:yes stop_codon:yes gene_type:complete